jgi:hypothetical protein
MFTTVFKVWQSEEERRESEGKRSFAELLEALDQIFFHSGLTLAQICKSRRFKARHP